MNMERLQNILSHAGIASRRHAADLIAAGRVTVDGLVIREPGARFDPASAKIALDGRPVAAAEKKRTIMLYKPVGVLSSMSDPFGGKTVADLIYGKSSAVSSPSSPAVSAADAIAERLVPVGRLDKDSEGMMLMSNDGELTLRLTHPRFEHEKTYVVRAAGRWNEEKLAILRGRIRMPDGYEIRPCRVRVASDAARDAVDEFGYRREPNVVTLEFRLREGRKRQIRYMCSAAHLVVLSLKRVAVGSLRLDPALKPGEWRDLTSAELELLQRSSG